jgi:hypothetical protein
MHIQITNIDDPDREAVIRAAVLFYGKKLLPTLYKKITVTINYNKDIPVEFEAETNWMDKNVFPKQVEMSLCKGVKNFRKILQTLAHEMVHVKQFAKGEIYDHKYRRTFKWGKRHFNIDKEDYWDLPWEIEAYGRELGLYIKFKDYYDLTDRSLEKSLPLVVERITKYDKKYLEKNTKQSKIERCEKGDTNAVVVGTYAEEGSGRRAVSYQPDAE